MNDVAVDVGESEVAAGVVVGEAFVVETQKMQDGRLEVVNVDFVPGDMEAEVVGLAVASWFGAAAGHEGGEGLRVVVTSGLAAEGRVGFYHRSAAEFSAPDDEGLVEESVAFEVLNKGRGCLGRLLAVIFGGALNVGVGVPAGVVDVDEPDAALNHPSGEEASAGKGVFVPVAAVKIDRFVGLGF